MSALAFLLAAAAALGGRASADERLTAVSADGGYYLLDGDTACRPLRVPAGGSASGYPECQRLSAKGRAALGLVKPVALALDDGRRLAARLVAARPGDPATPKGPAPLDPLSAKPRKLRDDRLAVVAVGPDGKEEVLAIWSGRPEVVAAEAVVGAPGGRSVVAIYDYASAARATVALSAVGFDLSAVLGPRRTAKAAGGGKRRQR